MKFREIFLNLYEDEYFKCLEIAKKVLSGTIGNNILILVFYDAYDVITKTTDNARIDESEDVYEYVLCAICPVSLSDPSLRYSEGENKIKARIRADSPWITIFPKRQRLLSIKNTDTKKSVTKLQCK